MSQQHRQRERRRRELLRSRVAAEAARILVNDRLAERQTAVQRAARELGIDDPAARPSDDALDAAVRDYRRLFGGGRELAQLAAQRAAAVEAMRFFAAWSPRLCGPVLTGTADADSPVVLQLFADDGEAVLRFLIEQGIPHDGGSRRVRLDPRRSIDAPTLSFSADGIGFELWLLPPAQLRQAPWESNGERPMARATLGELLALIAGGEG